MTKVTISTISKAIERKGKAKDRYQSKMKDVK